MYKKLNFSSIDRIKKTRCVSTARITSYNVCYTKLLPRGMKQRPGIAQALIHRPKLLICDEPTSALDPAGRKDIIDILRTIKSETTVLFSTHIV